MIIFYNKSGQIEGIFEGRIHDEVQKKASLGTDNKKLLIEWQQTNEREEIVEKKIINGWEKDKEGFDNPIYKIIKQKVKKHDLVPMIDNQELEPEQLKIILEIEKNSLEVYNYKVKNNKLVKK